MDSNINSGTISFFTLDPFNVDDIFFPIDLDNLANLLTSEMSSYYLKVPNIN